MSDQYTPTTDTVRELWEERTGDTAEFDRWLAALRQTIASEIEAMPVDGTEGIIIRDDAARIARGKD